MYSMNQKILHRGPDGSGVWSNASQNLVLGHNRLSIIDLSDAAAQPMVDEQTHDALVFNGEIYNYEEVKSKLEPHGWATQSDTEVLFTVLKKQGLEALSQLNGMFAFAYWHNSEEKLYLAIDPLGKKPLYYTTKGGFFAFSSEIKALLELPWVAPEMDKEAFYHFLTFNQLIPPATMFKGIYKLAPGEALVVGKEGIERQAHYHKNVLKENALQTEEEWSDAILTSFREAVKYRMVSDVPVGAFLSGGVDSSAVVAQMRALSDKPISTYTIGFKGQPDYDERIFASQIATRFNTDHHEKVVEPLEVEEFISKIAYIFDEPMVDSTGIPIYFLAQSARQHQTKVVLTGDGADEMFIGYRSWQRYLRKEDMYKKVKSLPKPLKGVMAAMAEGLRPNHPATEMLHRARANREFFWGGAKSFKESQKRRYLHSNFFEGIDTSLDSYSIIQHYKKQYVDLYGNEENLAKWMSFLGMEFLIPNWYMHRMDKLGMANSIEIRSPIVDLGLKQLALTCPPELKARGGEPKYIFKKALEGTLDHEVLYRKKMGFCVPIKEWGRDIMLDFLEQNATRFCKDTGLLDTNQVVGQVKEFRKNSSTSINDMFTLYYLINWHKEWME